jgi:hypothetical protein
MFANTYTLTTIQSCTLEQRVHALIRRSVVIPYDILIALSTPKTCEHDPVSPAAIVQAALQVSVIVQGNFVVSSECLFGGETGAMSLTQPTMVAILSALSAPPSSNADIMICNMRNTILVSCVSFLFFLCMCRLFLSALSFDLQIVL